MDTESSNNPSIFFLIAPTSGHVRPRRSRRSATYDIEERGFMSTSSPVGLSSTISIFLTIMILSVSIEGFPLRSMEFHSKTVDRESLRNKMRTIQTNGWFRSDNQRGTTPLSKIKDYSRSALAFRNLVSMRSNVDGYSNKDGGEGEEYADDLFEELDNEKVFPLEFDDDEEDDKEYLERGLERLESMEKMLQDIEEYCSIDGMCDDEDEDNEEDDDMMMMMGDVDNLEDMESLFDFLEETMDSDVEEDVDDIFDTREDGEAIQEVSTAEVPTTVTARQDSFFSPIGLEEALLQGVVPVDSGVGSGTLPGDFGFDPFRFADKDYVKEFQYRFLNWLPGGNPNNDPPPKPRPTALVLRDYREAEIRHGRLAMLAVIIWPIQEKIDHFVLGTDTAGPLLYGPVTLPYLPLFMTLVMMLLGYLDIYAKDIQEEEGLGDAFLPGDCFWDPLSILQGAPAMMKRNMQERELFNGRVAMLAFAAFVFEELTSHQAIVDIPSNEVLFVPAYQIPVVQEWLDSQFLETYTR